MGAQKELQQPSLEQLDTYSTAALLALQARIGHGYGTTYDAFLWHYIGSPQADDPGFVQISRPAASGAKVAYNNPATVHRSFSREGSMVNVRHAQGMLKPEDKLAEYFVASADLRTGEITEWQVVQSARIGAYGKQVVALSLVSTETDLSKFHPAPVDATSDTLATTLAWRMQQTATSCARLVLNQENGNMFGPVVGSNEPLFGIGELVKEVNALTTLYGLELDSLSREQVDYVAQTA